MEWHHQNHCPACGGSPCALGTLRIEKYQFCGRTIGHPQGGVRLLQCVNCRLVFKNLIPTKAAILTLFSDSEHELWKNSYDYRDEARVVSDWAGQDFDLLDVGAADGRWLGAAPGRGRRCALDIVLFKELEVDEFIRGFLDDELSWSNRRYDVITAFDVFEHLYDPAAALHNIVTILKPGGHLILETGNADAYSPLADWYYLSMLDHHIAWSEAALRGIAARHGLDILTIERKKHKSAPAATWQSRARPLLYSASPRIYGCLQQLMNKPPTVPGDPAAIDHLRVVMRLREDVAG